MTGYNFSHNNYNQQYFVKKKILIESVPEWFPLDANFLVAVLEERGRTLRHYVLHPQSYLHVLEEPLHEPQEMLRCSDVPRHCL